MLEEIQSAIQDYDVKWRKLTASRQNQAFFNKLKPVAAGWKAADKAEYDKLYAELKGLCDKTVETWMNGRWIAKMHLKDTVLPGGIEIIKLMQRRPGSDDKLGLDHLDFYSPEVTGAEEILKDETSLNWTRENNDAVDAYDWLSIWFEGTEAKLKASTVLDIVIHELQAINNKITKS